MPTLSFPPRYPTAASRLPLTLISLEAWALVKINGADRISYLQGQLTQDVAALPENSHLLAAHCDAKGKMWSNLRLFHRGEGLVYLERRSLRDNQINELKKYAVFSKVTIEADEENILLGLAGFQARTALAKFFDALPDAENPLVQQGDTTLLWFATPAERFLLVTSVGKAQAIRQGLEGEAQLNDSTQWLALDIEAGLPVIDAGTSAQFIPQATNLQALDAISFKKGCYTGQEMVARARFRGANKRAMYWLAGSAAQVPAANDSLEMKLGDNWRRTGTILSACRLDNSELWVQAVLNNDLEPNTELRVLGDEGSTLTIQPLPYTLT